MTDPIEMVEISRYMNREQAELARERLLEAGIESNIPDDLLYNIHAGISAASGGIRLLVTPDRLEEAQTILEKSSDEYPLPTDFDPTGPAEATPVEAESERPSYTASFVLGGFIAVVLLGVWISLIRRIIAIRIGYIVIVFLAGGVLGLILRICSRVLSGNGGGKGDEG